MPEYSLTLEFNTAITALTDDGKFDEKTHADTVHPLFLAIKKHDGISSCYVGPYSIKVSYMTAVINKTEATDIVKMEVEKAAASPELKLFPLRGEKQPTVAINPKPAPSIRQTLTIHFATDVIEYPTHVRDQGFGQEEFNWRTYELRQALVRFDGVLDYKLTMRGVAITFDARYTDDLRLMEHASKTLLRFAKKRAYFPYTEKHMEGADVIAFEKVVDA